METTGTSFMVICTDINLAVGERPTTGVLSDINRAWHKQPFTVLRRASREEYEEFCRREWNFHGPWEERPYYYLVAID